MFRRHRGTSFAGVPYTFELLESVGFDAADLPDLRYMTQAGGRMPPERVHRFAELAQRSGLRAVRDVRRDRGDSPDVLPATRTRTVPAQYDRPSDPRRIIHDRATRRMGRRRRRRAGLPRPQRDDGLRARARRPGARQDGRDSAHGRHRQTSPRRTVRGSRPQQPIRQDVRPAHRSPTGRGRTARPRACRRSAPATTTASWSPPQAGTTTAKSNERRPRRRVCPRVPCAPSPSTNCRCCRRASPTTRPCAGWRAPTDQPRVHGPARVVRRCAAGRRRHHRSAMPASSTSAAIRCPTSR